MAALAALYVNDRQQMAKVDVGIRHKSRLTSEQRPLVKLVELGQVRDRHSAR